MEIISGRCLQKTLMCLGSWIPRGPGRAFNTLQKYRLKQHQQSLTLSQDTGLQGLVRVEHRYHDVLCASAAARKRRSTLGRLPFARPQNGPSRASFRARPMISGREQSNLTKKNVATYCDILACDHKPK